MRNKLKIKLSYFQQDYKPSTPLITPEDVARLKQSGDSSPEVRVYCISHEGDCTGKVVGRGSVATRYARGIISKLNDTLKAGVKVFLGHSADNSHDGREEIGEVVKSFVKDVDGKLSQFAAVYIKPQFRNLKLDVASLETNVECEYDGESKFNVVDVEPITGLALGDSSKDSPGFAGATLRAAAQYFLDNTKAGPMTLKEILEAIREEGLKPSDVFSKRELDSDEVVGTLKKAHSDKEFEHRKKVQEKLDESVKSVETLTAELETAKTTNKDLFSKVSKSMVADISGAIIKDNKFDDKLTKFVTKELESFSLQEPADDKVVKASVGEFITKSVDKYKEYAELMGVKITDDKPPVKGDDSIDPGKVDYTDPKSNDLIG